NQDDIKKVNQIKESEKSGTRAYPAQMISSLTICSITMTLSLEIVQDENRRNLESVVEEQRNLAVERVEHSWMLENLEARRAENREQGVEGERVRRVHFGEDNDVV
ncbi:10160_t:CDS:2, partial [Scutellospora calospora]